MKYPTEIVRQFGIKKGDTTKRNGLLYILKLFEYAQCNHYIYPSILPKLVVNKIESAQNLAEAKL